MLFIGIDGGGTKTEGLLCNGKGELLARTTSGASNPHVIGFASSARLVTRLIRTLIGEAGDKEGPVTVTIGLAGLGRDVDVKAWRQCFAEQSERSWQAIVTHDAEIALFSGTFGEDGMVCIAGTGSIAFGVNDGKRARVGGWGHFIGADPGSGYSIGYDALQVIFAAFDQEQQTDIGLRLLKHLNVETLPEAIPILYKQANPKQFIASLAPLVFDAALSGDEDALSILNKTSQQICRYGLVLFEKLYSEQATTQVPFVLAGGLIQNRKLRSMIERELSCLNIPVQPIVSTFKPVYGALFHSYRQAGFSARATAQLFAQGSK